MRVSYDGQGGVTYADGRPLEPFAHVHVDNASQYQIAPAGRRTSTPTNAAARVPPPAARPRPLAEPQRRCGSSRRPRPRPPRPPADLDRADPRAVPGRVGAVGRSSAHDDRMLVPADVHRPALAGAASGCCCTSARSTGRRDGLRQRQAGRHAPRRLRRLHRRHHRRARRHGGPQELIVGVVGPDRRRPASRSASSGRAPSGIWYTPSSGIWQTVWLEPVAGAHIDRLDADAGRRPASALHVRP